MSRWKEVRVGDLVDIEHGYAFDGGDFSPAPTRRILFTPRNIHSGGGFSRRGFTYYDGPVDARYILEPGQIVTALTDLSREGAILGCSARVPLLPNREFLHNQRIGKVVFRSRQVTPSFLYWLLRTPDYRAHIIGAASGTAVRHTSPARIKDYRFRLPPTGEQQKITRLLDALESKADILQEAGRVLEEKAMTLFHRMFSDPGPRVPLGRFGRIVCGKTPSKKVKEYFGGTIPFIKIPDMRDRVYVTATADSLTHDGAARQPNKQLPPHAVCVSCIATIGRVVLTSAPCFTNQQINSIIPHRPHHRYYLYCRLKSMAAELENLGRGGSTTPNISTGEFSLILTPEPTDITARNFHRVVDPMFKRILANAHRIDCLDRELDKLLPQLMAGERPASTVEESA